MHDLSDWHRLDHAAYRVTMKRSVRRVGWVFVAAGAVITVCGAVAPLYPMLGIGVVIFLAGVWNVRRPDVSGLLVDGIAVILVGAFQCLAGQWIQPSHEASETKWLIGGLLQIAWGVRRLKTWYEARQAVNDREAIGRLERIVADVSRRRAKSDPTIAEFRTGRWKHERNRLWLSPEGVVGLLPHMVVRLERRNDMHIETRGTTGPGGTLKVSVQMSGLMLSGHMSSEHFQRFESWKLGQTRPAAA
jgi:hypothetical protein